MRKKVGIVLLLAGVLWLVVSWFMGGPGLAQWLLIISGICLITIKRKKPQITNDLRDSDKDTTDKFQG